MGVPVDTIGKKRGPFDLPEVLGNWNSVHKQFRRWCVSGVWDVLSQAPADSGGDGPSVFEKPLPDFRGWYGC